MNNTNDTTPDAAILAQQAAILAVNEMAVPVISRDRHIARKELAKLVRGLFKTLGIKGVSVTTPSYSMAHGIDIVLPKRDDYVWLDKYDVDPKCEARVNNNRVNDKINEILARAFPQHDDRSDSQDGLLRLQILGPLKSKKPAAIAAGFTSVPA